MWSNLGLEINKTNWNPFLDVWKLVLWRFAPRILNSSPFQVLSLPYVKQIFVVHAMRSCRHRGNRNLQQSTELKKHEENKKQLLRYVCYVFPFFLLHFVGQGTTALTSWETSLASYRFLLAMACWLGHMQCSAFSEWKKNETTGQVWIVQTKMNHMCVCFVAIIYIAI